MRTRAADLGLTPENRSSALVPLGDHGVAVSGHTITITIKIRDKTKLRRLARPHALIEGPGP